MNKHVEDYLVSKASNYRNFLLEIEERKQLDTHPMQVFVRSMIGLTDIAIA